MSSSATYTTPAPFSTTSVSITPSIEPLLVPPLFEFINDSEYESSTLNKPLRIGVPINGTSARERHRIASARSWRKQKNAISDLQATVSLVEAQREVLHREYSRVLSQVHDLYDALLKHVDCNEPAISGLAGAKAGCVGWRRPRRRRRMCPSQSMSEFPEIPGMQGHAVKYT
ncbi:hypothetical protein ACHAQH_008415 [Verticillium albo-atrum]